MDEEFTLEGFEETLLELEIKARIGDATQFGVMVACSDDGQEQTSIFYDAEEEQLTFDATKASLNYGVRNIEKAPFTLQQGEELTLRVFVDRSIIEVFANDRQAIGRRVYPSLHGRGVKLFAKGGDVEVISVKGWEVMPSNPY